MTQERKRQLITIKSRSKAKAGLSPILLLFTTSLILGILLNYYLHLPFLPICLLGSGAFVASLALLFFNRQNKSLLNILQVVFLGAFMTAVGLWTQHSYFKRHTNLPTLEQTVYQAVVKGEPTIGERSVRIKVEATKCWMGDSAVLLPMKPWIMVSLPVNDTSSNLLYGDEIVFSTKVSPSKNHHDNYRFDYDKYLLQHAIGGLAFVRQGAWQKLDSKPHFSIRRMAYRCRRNIFEKFEKMGVSNDELALLSSLTIGRKDLLTRSLREDYSKVGASHILAVSGMHVGILFLVLSTLLLPLDWILRNKYVKPLIIIVCLWFYAFLVGLSPSIIRACMLITLAYINRIGPEGEYSLNFIFFTAWLDLIFNPMAIFDLSFQLSYAAVTSIIVVLPTVNGRLVIRSKVLRAIYNMFWMTLAAQFATSPIIALHFHKLSLVFLLGSFVVVLFAYIIIGLAMVCLILPLSLSKSLAVPLNLFLKWMNGGINGMAAWSNASFDIWISEFQAVLWAMAVVVCLLTVFKYRGRLLQLALLLGCLAVVPSIYRTLKDRTFNETKLYVSGRGTMINVVDNSQGINRVYLLDSAVVDLAGIKWDFHNCSKPQIKQIDKSAAFVLIPLSNGKSVGILQTMAWLLPEEVSCDWLVLTKEARVNQRSLEEKIHCKALVVDRVPSARKLATLKGITQQTNLQLITAEDWFGSSVDLD